MHAGSDSVSVTLEVLPGTVARPTPLARTGAEISDLLGVAIALVVFGVLALFAARPRRLETHHA